MDGTTRLNDTKRWYNFQLSVSAKDDDEDQIKEIVRLNYILL